MQAKYKLFKAICQAIVLADHIGWHLNPPLRWVRYDTLDIYSFYKLFHLEGVRLECVRLVIGRGTASARTTRE